MTTVDLNADLGESFGRYSIGNDEKIIPLITSANVACGFHAGDPSVLLATLEMIKKSGSTKLGAHPGYPDLQGFGRRYLDMPYEEVRAMLLYQLAAIDGLANTVGVELTHVKPHGALYNQTFVDKDLARVIAETVKEYNPKLKLMGLSQQNLVRAGKDVGLDVIHEVFADRAYEADGTLVSRRKDGAMITDTDLAVQRVVRMVTEGKVESFDGQDIDIQVDSICVHGDGEKALQFVQEIIDGLKKEGIIIQAI